MNNCTFVGKLIANPELRYLPEGTPVTSFTLSVYDPFAKGEYKSILVNVVAWRKQAEVCADRLIKGSQVAVAVRYSPRSYDGNDGKKVYVHEFTVNDVRFLDSGNRSETSSNNSNNSGSSNRSSSQKNDPFIREGAIDISDDDLPF